MRILTLDIECSPNMAYVWSLFNQNVSLAQLVDTGEVISFAAKWHGKKKVLFYSTFHDGKPAMLQAAHDMLSEADVVVGYNSRRFDMTNLNKEFILAGMEPPAPYQQVDLLTVVRKQFRFSSNKLDHVSQQLGLGAKTSHTGFQLWVDCIAGKRAAWDLMKKYNKQDVVITEKLYDKLMPWIHNHPNKLLYEGREGHGCTNCGSAKLTWQGYRYTVAGKYRRFQCSSCGKWGNDNKRVLGSVSRGIA